MIKSILVVDDEPEQLLMVESLLKERGYTVVVASDGEEGLKKALQVRPDLILLDIMMPRMDGTETASRLKNDPRTKNIPIFFLTAVIAAEDRKNFEGNTTPIFAKPVIFSELLDAIRQL